MSSKSFLPLLKTSSLVVLCLAAVSLAGCGTDDLAMGSIASDDYHDRHPIILAQAPTTLDIFQSARASSTRLRPRISEFFAARYQAMGSGRLLILAPAVGGHATRAAVEEIRRVLVSTGLRGSIGLGSYPPPMRPSPRHPAQL